MKKLLASIPFLILVAALLCGNVSAAAENCPCCGMAYEDCNWQPWTLTQGGTDNILTEGGHYYLTDNVTTTSGQFRIGDTGVYCDGTPYSPSITLDLRGYTISSSTRVFAVYPDSTLSIVDTVGSGTVQGKQCTENQVGGTIRVNDGATLNLYGGTVRDAASSAHAANGAVIATEGQNVTINIAGGNVTGGAFAPYGGAIFAARNATVNISAGTVTGGSAFLGGAVYVDNAALNITGGEIVGGTVTTEGAAEGADAGFGGAVYACNNAVVTVSGGTITGGTAYHGGAVALMSAGMTMQDGTIYGGAVTGYGTAIHLLADTVNEETPVPCTLEISGGTVDGSQDVNSNGAITVGSNAHTVTISGGTVKGSEKYCGHGSAVSGLGTAATINITGGTFTGSANANNSRGVIYSRGFLNITGGDITVTKGTGSVVCVKDRYGLLTVGETVAESLSGQVRLETDANVSSGSGALAVADDTSDGIWYYEGTEAVDNCPDGGFVRSFGGGTLNLQGKTVYVDVNGQTLTVTNGTFYGFDSENDNYAVSQCGTVTVGDGAVSGASCVTSPTGNSYIAVSSGETLSFHRFNIQLPYVYLRTADTKEGIFYGATLQADRSVISAMKTYGVALTPDELADDSAWTEAMDDRVRRSTYATSDLVASKVNELRSTSLINIINISNNYAANTSNVNTTIYARAYIELNDGTFIYSDAGNCSMKQILQLADSRYSRLTDSQKRGLLGMYERFSSCMKYWGLSNIKADYPNGTDQNGESLILQYRRNKAIANMVAQTEVVWSIETADGNPISYSRNGSSGGLEADESSVIYTLYPGRTYVGLPYSHGSASLEMFLTRATLKDGVYVVEDAHSSLFSGGSKVGSEENGQYNIARLGNDCWDAISWAYESVGSSVTANQTAQLVEKYGMYPVGEYDITACLGDNGYIDDAKVKALYTTMEEAGTLQTMYRSYALLQPGYTLVNAGHAVMVTGVDVVYNDDGSIDPDSSIISIIEQGSAHEKAQSILDANFDGTLTDTATSDHSTGHTNSSPNNCRTCAEAGGYDEATGRFVISSQGSDYTFTARLTSGYIPVAPKELTDPACTPDRSTITDSVSDASVLGVYTGKLSSSYRVQKVTLDIFDATTGEKVNTSACLGIQSGLTSAFDMTRFVTDQTLGTFGSVLAGTPALQQGSYTYTVEGEYVYTASDTGTYYQDEAGNYIEITGDVVAPDGATLYTRTEKTVTATWLEAPDLPAGSYSFTMTCVLGNGYTKTFRSGFFVVGEGTTPEGNTATNMVFAD